jgi:hypothetical protein
VGDDPVPLRALQGQEDHVAYARVTGRGHGREQVPAHVAQGRRPDQEHRLDPGEGREPGAGIDEVQPDGRGAVRPSPAGPNGEPEIGSRVGQGAEHDPAHVAAGSGDQDGAQRIRSFPGELSRLA